MVWRIGQSSHQAGRYLLRHRLYIMGACAWVITASLVASSFSGTQHAQGTPTHKETRSTLSTSGRQQVAGAETSTPSKAKNSQKSRSDFDLSIITGGTIAKDNSKHGPGGAGSIASTPSVPSPDDYYASAIPPKDDTPVTPTPPVVVPPTDPTPPPPDPVPPAPDPPATPPAATDPPVTVPVCTVDPLAGFSLLGNNAVTVTAGAESAAETLTTSTGASVIWEPGSAIVWGDGTNTDPAAAVSLVVGYSPSAIAGASVSYSVRAAATTAPGAYNVSWNIVAGPNGTVCYSTTIQVTVVAAPVPDPAPVP